MRVMQSAVEVLVPVPRRWADGLWRAATRPPRTRDLRMILVLAFLGGGFWLALALAVWTLV